MTRTLKICVVFAWATIGTQVALTVNPWLGWVGLIVGAVGGYLTMDWKTVVWAIPHAARRATGWRPNLAQWGRRFGVFTLLVIVLLAWAGSIGLPVALACVGFRHYTNAEFSTAEMMLPTGAMTFVLLMVHLANAIGAVEQSKGNKQFSFALVLHTHPWYYVFIAMCEITLEAFACARRIFRTLPAAAQTISASVKTASRFCWHLYRLIHTEERLLCSVDIALGVALGWWFASPLIGGASGAAFWLVNRLLIAGYLLRTLPVRVRS